MKWGDWVRTDKQLRACFAELGAMPHMRPELRALFLVMSDAGASTRAVWLAAAYARECLRDVERLVAGEKPHPDELERRLDALPRNADGSLDVPDDLWRACQQLAREHNAPPEVRRILFGEAWPR